MEHGYVYAKIEDIEKFQGHLKDFLSKNETNHDYFLSTVSGGVWDDEVNQAAITILNEIVDSVNNIRSNIGSAFIVLDELKDYLYKYKELHYKYQI